jgi:hypothetical protein
MDTLTTGQYERLETFNKEVNTLTRKLTIYEEEEREKPPSYNKTRAANSLKFHQTELADLEKEFERKKQEHLDAIEAANVVLSSESAILVRTRTRLRLVKEERDTWLQEAIKMNQQQSHSAPIRQPSIPLTPSCSSSVSTTNPTPPQPFSDPFGEWDTSGMTTSEITEMLQNRQRRGETIPTHLLHYLQPAKARELPEAPSVPIIKPSVAPQPMIPSLSPPPPAKKQPKMPAGRQPLKQLGASTALYPRPPIDGDSP